MVDNPEETVRLVAVPAETQFVLVAVQAVDDLL